MSNIKVEKFFCSEANSEAYRFNEAFYKLIDDFAYALVVCGVAENYSDDKAKSIAKTFVDCLAEKLCVPNDVIASCLDESLSLI